MSCLNNEVTKKYELLQEFKQVKLHVKLISEI